MKIHGTEVKAIPYAHPPITEAVIEVKVATPLDSKSLEKLNTKFNKNYPDDKVIQSVRFELIVKAGGQPAQAPRSDGHTGHRRSSADMTQLLLLWPDSLVVSQLAPYIGWEAFFDRFSRDWKVWKRSRGFQEINRIGVRFINRIDIPLENGIAQHVQYLNIYPKLPDSIEAIDSYAVQTLSRLEDINCMLTINSASVPSPLLGHVSFMLDIDIAKAADLPQNDKEIFKLLNQIREKKNRIFEDCVSDRARERF